MGVAVDSAGLKRAARRAEGGGFWVLFRSQSSSRLTRDQAESAVAEAVAAGNALFLETHDRVIAAVPSVMPAGSVTFVQECDTMAVWGTWLAAVAAHLEQAGWTGRVKEVTNDHTPYDRPGSKVVATGAGVSLQIDHERMRRETIAARAGTGRLSRWFADEKVTRETAEAALEFILQAPGTIFLRQSMVQFKVDAASAAEGFWHLMAEPTIPTALTRVTPAGDLVRVVFDCYGHVHYEARDVQHGWEAEVEVLLAQLDELLPVMEYGLVRRISSPCVGWSNLLDARPPRPLWRGSAYSGARALEASRVADAYGIQLLTDDHLRGAADLSRWQVERVSDRFSRVSAPDLAAWFGVDEPSEAVLTRARDDFGPLILDERDRT